MNEGDHTPNINTVAKAKFMSCNKMWRKKKLFLSSKQIQMRKCNKKLRFEDGTTNDITENWDAVKTEKEDTSRHMMHMYRIKIIWICMIQMTECYVTKTILTFFFFFLFHHQTVSVFCLSISYEFLFILWRFLFSFCISSNNIGFHIDSNNITLFVWKCLSLFRTKHHMEGKHITSPFYIWSICQNVKLLKIYTEKSKWRRALCCEDKHIWMRNMNEKSLSHQRCIRTFDKYEWKSFTANLTKYWMETKIHLIQLVAWMLLLLFF